MHLLSDSEHELTDPVLSRLRVAPVMRCTVSVSPLSDENNAAGFSDALDPSDDCDIKLSLRSAWVRVALTSHSCMNIAAGFPVAFCAYRGEISIFRNSPSSRSDSAMLSAES